VRYMGPKTVADQHFITPRLDPGKDAVSTAIP
jgi:hypothetical protein